MGFLDDLSKNLNKVGKKTSEMANVAKLKLDIKTTKSAIDKKYEEIGARMYFLNKEGAEDSEFLVKVFEEVDGLFEKISELEAEIKKISSEEDIQEVTEEVVEGKKCPNCGAEVGDSKFCNSCGTEIE